MLPQMAPPVRHPPQPTHNSCKIQLNTKKIIQLTRGYFTSIVSANIFKENKGNTWQRVTTRRFRVSAITEPYLEAAEERIYGQGDGRIFEKDAEEIVELSKDGGRITETELQT